MKGRIKSEGQKLRTVKIRRNISQGDSLSLLLFVSFERSYVSLSLGGCAGKS